MTKLTSVIAAGLLAISTTQMDVSPVASADFDASTPPPPDVICETLPPVLRIIFGCYDDQVPT